MEPQVLCIMMNKCNNVVSKIYAHLNDSSSLETLLLSLVAMEVERGGKGTKREWYVGGRSEGRETWSGEVE